MWNGFSRANSIATDPHTRMSESFKNFSSTLKLYFLYTIHDYIPNVSHMTEWSLIIAIYTNKKNLHLERFCCHWRFYVIAISFHLFLVPDLFIQINMHMTVSQRKTSWIQKLCIILFLLFRGSAIWVWIKGGKFGNAELTNQTEKIIFHFEIRTSFERHGLYRILATK